MAGSRTAPPRHHTLRAAVEWSYDLLSQTERQLFNRLAVFSGGWTLPAVEAVCAAEGIQPEHVLEVLAHLVEKSLVLAGPGADRGTRYRLLETLRQYAQERLRGTGELEALHRRHGAFFLELAEHAEPHFWGAGLASWVARLEREHDNLRGAIGWAIDHGEVETALRLGGALWQFWGTSGYAGEGWAWISKLLDIRGGSRWPAARAMVVLGAAAFANYRSDYTAARALGTESLALYRGLGDERGIAWSLLNVGHSARARGERCEARSLYEAGVAAAQAAGHRPLRPSTTITSGALPTTRATTMQRVQALFAHWRCSERRAMRGERRGRCSAWAGSVIKRVTTGPPSGCSQRASPRGVRSASGAARPGPWLA